MPRKNSARAIAALARACLVGVAFCGAAVAYAFAQAPAGYEKIYDEPTDVNLGGRWVVADIALYADMNAAGRNDLRLALVTDVTKFIEETERDLENWVAAHQERCGERWRAGAPMILFPDNAIRFVLDLEFEVWTCGVRGRAEPARIVYEAGRIDVTLDPYIEDGKLQARLDDFSIDNRAGVSKYLPLEFVARRVIEAELNNLNQNRKFYRAPDPLYAEGFAYASIEGQKTAGERVIITARYRATGGSEKLGRLIEAMREDGITQ